MITEGELFDDGAYDSALAGAGRLVELERQIAALYAEQNKLRTQRLSLAPWLGLDLPLETASTPEVAVLFGTVAGTADLDALERALAEKSELTQVLRAGSDAQLQYLVLICHRSAEADCQEVLKDFGFSRSALRGWTGTAAENDRRLSQEMAQSEQALADTVAQVAAFAPQRGALEQALDRSSQEISREEARCRLLDSGTAFFLDGWVPAPEEERLLQRLRAFTCCWETEDPLPEDYPRDVLPPRL